MYLWGLLADSRRIFARGRCDREEPHLTVNVFCKLAVPRAGPCETRDSISIVPRVQIARWIGLLQRNLGRASQALPRGCFKPPQPVVPARGGWSMTAAGCCCGGGAGVVRAAAC